MSEWGSGRRDWDSRVTERSWGVGHGAPTELVLGPEAAEWDRLLF